MLRICTKQSTAEADGNIGLQIFAHKMYWVTSSDGTKERFRDHQSLGTLNICSQIS